ncbi:hypothetical protein J6590_089147 [Homalodisca vitripennis]|nr:hypothetical protein J6590_089147 [Homalodisca vitripennis]
MALQLDRLDVHLTLSLHHPEMTVGVSEVRYLSTSEVLASLNKGVPPSACFVQRWPPLLPGGYDFEISALFGKQSPTCFGCF